MAQQMISCNAVLFDLDGVLVDSLPDIVANLRAWAMERGLDPERVVALSHGRPDLDLVRLAAPEFDALEEVRTLQEREMATANRTRATPGAHRVTTALGAAPWAVVTSGSRAVAQARLAAAELRTPPALITSDDVTAGKPDPQGYLAAARRLGVPAEQCLVIEDAPTGVAAARAAAMRVVGVAGTVDRSELPADVVVDTLEALRVHPGRGIEIIP